MKIRRGFMETELAVVALFLISVLAFIGWVLNIVALASMDFAHVTGMHIIRIIGIFVAPLGSFAGWFL
jgi:hypothetical protein